MSDNGSGGTPATGAAWAAPGASAAVPSRADPAVVPLPPPTGARRDGPTPVLPAPSGDVSPRRLGWTPPPKRGLLPLRPIPLGAILGAPFRLQRRAPRTTLAPALVLSVVATALAAFLQWALTVGPEAALDAAYYDDFVTAQNLLGALQQVGGVVPVVLALAATALLAGSVVVAASRALLAERVSFAGMRWRLSGRVARLVGWAAIVLVVGAAALALAAVPPVMLALSSPLGNVFGFLVGLLEAVGLVLVGGYLAARLGFTGHVIALEGLRLRPAIVRSWRLTRGSGFRLFGSQLLVWVVVGLAAAVLTTPVGWALDLGLGLVFPTGPTPGQYETYLAVRTVVVLAVTAITGAFGLVVQSVTAALLYLDQRMRVEGLDLVLARYVDERERGVGIADPFPGGGTA